MKQYQRLPTHKECGLGRGWWRDGGEKEKKERKERERERERRWARDGTKQELLSLNRTARVLPSIHQLCTYKSSKAPKNACMLLIDLPSPGSRHTLFISGNQVCSLLTREGEGAGVHSGFNHLP